MVFEEFKEQLERSLEGWYQTKLPLKENNKPLPTNETGSKRDWSTLSVSYNATVSMKKTMTSSRSNYYNKE